MTTRTLEGSSAQSRAQLGDALAALRPGHSLARVFYTDAAFFAADLEHVYYREWLFAGHDCEVADAGDWMLVDIGTHSVIVVRTADGHLKAHHNTCRHRGFRVCDAPEGHAKRRFVCPYHQWSYELDGSLARARQMGDDFDPKSHGLRPAHVASVGGLVFVCVAREAPDVAPLAAMVQPYLAPFELGRAKVAHASRIVEHGNWKLVMENNRECYHCSASHPELCRTFPEAPTHTGGGSADDVAAIDRLVAECEALGLPGRYRAAADAQYRVMRLPFIDDARAMTLSGKPAVAQRLGRVPAEPNTGDLLFYHYPNMWSHFTSDHAITFRILPISATETELVTRWLVHADAVEGRDYDLATLTEVWQATNAQDRALVERNQRGVASPAYEPGPYSPVHEEGVIQFVDWYRGTLAARLGGPAHEVVNPGSRTAPSGRGTARARSR